MNMISTGAFQNEMDASNKQPTLAEKFAAVWEKKNAKAARAGGVSLMALSLAACGSSDDTATSTPATTTPVEPVTPTVAGKALELTAATTADTLVGGDGNDTFTGAAGAYADTDSMIDPSTTDSDSATFVTKAGANPTIKNVENITITAESVAASALDMSLITGGSTLNFSKGDVVIGGSTIAASSVVEFDNVNSADVSTINVTGTVTTVDIDAAATDKAGVTLNAETATGNVTVDGAATINANASTGTVSVDAVTNTGATETVKATVINAAKATTVTTHADLAGSIEINAAAATTVTIADAQGGATINAAKGATTANGIDVRGIDASGVTITTGSYASTAAGTIDLAGSAGALDTATISGAGSINLDIGVATAAVDTLNLNANGAAVAYTITASNGALTSATLGDDVTATGNEAIFSTKTVTGTGTLNLATGTAGPIDLSGVDVGKIRIGFDNAHDPTANTNTGDNNITVGAGQTVEIYKDQDDLEFDFAGTALTGDLTMIAGDDNGALNTAVGTVTLGGVFRADTTLAGTVTIEANDANLTVTTTTTLGASQALVITGDEDVSLGTVAAKSVDASASTGKITMTTTTGVKTITTGSGVDNITMNSAATKHTVATGAGKDVITITATNDESSFDAGAGDDAIAANEAAKSYVVVAGDGNDTVTTTTTGNAAVHSGGAGTDTYDVNTGGAFDVSATTFKLAGFEKLDLVGVNNTMTATAAQFADFNTVEVNGDAAADILLINAAATGSTIDASGITVKTGGTVTLKYAGGAKDDVITGSTAAETFVYSLGSDSIAAGATGTDTLDFGADTTRAITGSDTSTGAVINLSGSAVSDATIYSKITQFTGNSVDVAAGTVGHVFAANKTTNSTQITSIDGIEDVVGGDGRDFIEGSGVANNLNGGAAADYIDGNDGDDTITGGAGNDELIGGNGADTFVFSASNGSDTITGFTTGSDKLNFSAITFQASTVDGAKSGTIANFDTMAEIQATAKSGAVIITETNKVVADLTTALNASAFDTDTDASAIFIIENSTDSKVEIYHASNADTDNDNDVAVTLLATLSDIAVVSNTIASADILVA